MAPEHDDATPPGPPDIGRRAFLLVPIVAVLVGLLVVVMSLPSGDSIGVVSSPSLIAEATPASTAGGPVSTVDPGRPSLSRGYLVSLAELEARVEQAALHIEPTATAVADLLAWADAHVGDRPHPMQPLIIVGTDNEFVDDARRAYGLGLAYAISGEDRYATAARATIRAWVDAVSSTGDVCTDSGDCHTSLIIGRAGAGFVFGADLIADSAVWTEADRQALATWMHDVLLPAASERTNNWGDAGTFLRVVAADYAGDDEAFDAALSTYRSMIDLIEADGRIPEEARRGAAGISYTQEALQYKVAVARIAERRGIDLWDLVGANGGSLKAAIDRLATYWTRPERWPDHPGAVVPSTGPFWEIAYAHWRDPAWLDITRTGQPYGDRGHSAIRWTTLTNGATDERQIAVATPTPSPTDAPSAPPAPSRTPAPTATIAPAAVTGIAVVIRDASTRTVTIAMSWDAPADPDASVELERSTDGSTWEAVDVGGDDASATDRIRAGAHVAYRVRATSGAGPGPWTYIEDVVAEWIDVSSRTTTLDGAWTSARYPDYSNGVAIATDDRGATMRWSGPVAEIHVIGPTGPTRGKMVIDIDGKRADVVSLYSSHFEPRVDLYSRRWGSMSEHGLQIEARPVDGRPTVSVDDLLTLGYRVSASPGS
jgi:Alginate lyase